MCVRTSHGEVVCGEMVRRGHQALPKQRYETRASLSKHGADRGRQEWNRSHGFATGRPSHKDVYVGRQDPYRNRAGSRNAVHQVSNVDAAKRARVQADVYGKRPRELASRERGVEIYTDRSHKPVRRAGSRAYDQPRVQQVKWTHSGEQPNTRRSSQPAGRARSVIYREPGHGQAAQRVRSQKNVYSDDAGQDVHQDEQRQTDGRNRGQHDQDQPDKN